VISLVIDASVAIKWVVEEEGSIEALVLRRYRMIAPDLLMAECGNILWKKLRRKELHAEEAHLAAQLLTRADIELFPMRRLLEATTRLSITLDHPAYDCIYLSLAAAENAIFISADERLIRKVQAAETSIRCLALSLSVPALEQGQRQ
jgi:predicted nucleic acid-binding protein